MVFSDENYIPYQTYRDFAENKGLFKQAPWTSLFMINRAMSLQA